MKMQVDTKMQRLSVYITVMMLLLSCACVFAAEGGSCTAESCTTEHETDLQGQSGNVAPTSSTGLAPGSAGQNSPGKGSDAGESALPYRTQQPDNSIKSRWQMDIGGSVRTDVGRTQ